jgi:hypothetical protein
VRDPPERESVTNLLMLRSKKVNNELLVSDHPSTQNHNSHRGAPHMNPTWHEGSKLEP